MYPDYLQKSIKEMEQEWTAYDSGKKKAPDPITWAGLSDDITFAFSRGEITLDEVKELQEKHLRIKF